MNKRPLPSPWALDTLMWANAIASDGIVLVRAEELLVLKGRDLRPAAARLTFTRFLNAHEKAT